MKVKRCGLADLPDLLEILPEDDSLSLLILRSKISHPHIFLFIDEEKKDSMVIYEFVSGDICILHTFIQPETPARHLMRLARETEKIMKEDYKCKLFMAIKESDRPEIGMLLGAGGGDRVYEMKDTNKVIYFKEVS